MMIIDDSNLKVVGKPLSMGSLLILVLLLLPTISAGQDSTIVSSAVEKANDHLIATLTLTNIGKETVYIETWGYRVASDSADSSYNRGLLGILMTDSGQFTPYYYPHTFVQMKNVRREVRRSDRINKRQYPRFKIKPNKYFIIEPGTTEKLIIKIPMQNWGLSRGENYKLVFRYDETRGKKSPKIEHLKQIRHFSTITNSFTY